MEHSTVVVDWVAIDSMDASRSCGSNAGCLGSTCYMLMLQMLNDIRHRPAKRSADLVVLVYYLPSPSSQHASCSP
eukprot:scaffold279556_cov46-Attheya_sp.AAC.1